MSCERRTATEKADWDEYAEVRMLSKDYAQRDKV